MYLKTTRKNLHHSWTMAASASWLNARTIAKFTKASHATVSNYRVLAGVLSKRWPGLCLHVLTVKDARTLLRGVKGRSADLRRGVCSKIRGIKGKKK